MPDFITLSQADFSDGDDNNVSTSAGQKPIEIATMEVGADGQAADYEKIVIGQPPRSGTNSRDTKGNEVFVDLKGGPGGATEAPLTTQIRFITRRRNDADGPNMTPYIPTREQNSSTPGNRKTLPPGNVRATDGRLVVLQARDPTNTYQVDRAASVIEIPALGFDKNEV